MSVEFRQRKPSEYLRILRRRKWLVILPVIAITTAVAWVVFRLPNVFESTTLIVVRPSNLPQGVVPTCHRRQHHPPVGRYQPGSHEP